MELIQRSPSPTLFQLSLARQFAPFLSKLGPPWFRRKLVEWTPHSAVQKIKDMSDIMHREAQKILHQKRELLRQSVLYSDGGAARGNDITTALCR